MKKIINTLIDNFIKKILIIDKEISTLENKIEKINELLDNLIDFCIKKKIYFYIEKKIGYTQIVNIFKKHLIDFIQKLIDPDNNIINKYISEQTDNFDNYSDINSLLFKKFKTNDTSEQLSKNHVSFRDDISIIGFEETEGFESNYTDYVNSFKQDASPIDIDKLALYIKILLSQNKFLIEFVEKINNMALVISDPTTEFNIKKPFL
jgi:DNA-dependent RNA polymerase auxiliary subunit epsilon